MDKRFGIFLGLACFGLTTANAGSTDIALTAKLGSLGLGIEGTFGLAEHFNARLGLNKLDYDRTETISDIQYDLDLELQSVSLLADWHPFGSAFRFTAGLMSNGNELTGSSTSDSLTIGDTTYQGIGLDAKLDFDSTAPYLGVGWGNALAAGKGWGFNVDLGIMFQGSGNVSLVPTGAGASLVDPADIALEEQRFEDDIKNYKYYPVFSFEASYRF
ncbi:MAG: hypothetical protein KZQ65_03140 [Candidatus Thiodiazotropha sp. (ex Gloverina cf. vestifex)]|nr:hypothetical protein [Candidatus Thiodiazotropha sp. (ex Gloverina cf. vestifex)]